MTARPLSLAHLTVLDLPPPALINAAAVSGFNHVGVRLNPVAPGAAAYPLMEDRVMLRSTVERQRDTGVTVFDIEIFMLKAETDVRAFLPYLEIGAQLGAHHVLAAGYDEDEDRMADNFASFCALAAPLGLTIDLEPMPWTTVPDINVAARLLRKAGQSNCGILIDVLHFDRSKATPADIAALPREWLNYFHLCDAPAEKPTTVEGLLHAARAERLMPGEGGIALNPIIQAVPGAIPAAIEVPMLSATIDVAERLRRLVATSRRVLEGK